MQWRRNTVIRSEIVNACACVITTFISSAFFKRCGLENKRGKKEWEQVQTIHEDTKTRSACTCVLSLINMFCSLFQFLVPYVVWIMLLEISVFLNLNTFIIFLFSVVFLLLIFFIVLEFLSRVIFFPMQDIISYHLCFLFEPREEALQADPDIFYTIIERHNSVVCSIPNPKLQLWNYLWNSWFLLTIVNEFKDKWLQTMLSLSKSF